MVSNKKFRLDGRVLFDYDLVMLAQEEDTKQPRQSSERSEGTADLEDQANRLAALRRIERFGK